MTDDASGKVPVTFAKGVLDDVADLTATAAEDDQASKDEAEALKRRIANCRRVRFDIPSQKGKPRFRLIYRNEPADGAPAECHWLTVAPRAGLRAHRKAQQRLRSD